ncbi:TPA: hypothetical protein ACSPJ7_005594 [Bacillus cereus]
MTIEKEDLYLLVDPLYEQDKNKAFAFSNFLIERSEKILDNQAKENIRVYNTTYRINESYIV